MNAATSSRMSPERPQRMPLIDHLRRHWSTWSWIAFLAVINLPLLNGDVRMDLLFFPEAAKQGQWWRIITYPLVHLSWYHLLLDAGGFLLLYTCLEEKRMSAKAFYLAGASAGSLFLSIALEPSVHQHGLSGLSGIAHGLMAITAMEMLGHKKQRTWGTISLLAVVSKSAYELWSGQVLFDFMHMGLCGRPMATSHAGGVMGGLLAFMLTGAWTKFMSRPSIETETHKSVKAPPNVTINTVQPVHQPSVAQRLLRLIAVVLARVFYRVRHEGLDRIPDRGPVVLVCNHVSYVDWLMIASACNRPVHFVMHAAIYRIPVLHWIFRLAKVIPIESARKNPALLRQAFKDMADTLGNGGVVCIFPEGSLTRTGRINRFKPGIEKIVRQTPVPVVPMAIRGLWGSFFSRKGESTMRYCRAKRANRIELAVGKSIHPLQASAHKLQGIVAELRGDLA